MSKPAATINIDARGSTMYNVRGNVNSIQPGGNVYQTRGSDNINDIGKMLLSWGILTPWLMSA